MKRTLVLLMTLAITLPVSANLVHHWTLDDAVSSGSTVVDSAGSLNGVTSASGVISVAGKIGTAFLFDGANSAAGGEVAVNNFSTTGLQSMTLAFWVKPDKDTLPVGTSTAQVYKRLIGGADNFEIVIHNATQKVANNLYIAGGSYPISNVDLDDTTPEWTHVAMTAFVSGTTVTTEIYIDGLFDKSGSNTYAAWAGGTLKFAMRTGANNNGHFKGALDDVRVYDKVLTADEIKAIPEPATMALLALGGLALLRKRS